EVSRTLVAQRCDHGRVCHLGRDLPRPCRHSTPDGHQRPAKSKASPASGSQASPEAGSRLNHSLIGVPLFAAKRTPSPAAASASTRVFGSFTTSRPLTSIAKILFWNRSACEPKPAPEPVGQA